MATIEQIIDNNIKTNGIKSITANVMNYVLKQLLFYINLLQQPIDITLTQDGSFQLLANDLLTVIVINSQTTFDLKIGTTEGGDDILNYTGFTGGVWAPVTLNFFTPQNTMIYISGINSNTNLKIYKK